MTKYRKKPVVVDAEQWFPGRYVEGVEEFTYYGFLKTPEGRVMVHPGDWIITGIASEKYPCQDGIFGKTYEPVEEWGVE